MPHPPVTACIALGSNLGDRRAHIAAASEAIASLPGTRLVAASTLHETAPVGPPGQENYLNACLRILTELAPRELLDALLAIERERGRVRDHESRWGPRTLDCDLILYADLTIDEPGLTVPHPRLHERLFVLGPLAEVARELRVPGRNASVGDLLDKLLASADNPGPPDAGAGASVHP